MKYDTPSPIKITAKGTLQVCFVLGITILYATVSAILIGRHNMHDEVIKGLWAFSNIFVLFGSAWLLDVIWKK